MKSEIFARFKETATIEHEFGNALAPAPPGCGSLKQVHGIDVREWSAQLMAADPSQKEGDGLFSLIPGQWIGIQTADCIPMLWAAKSRPMVMAVHAGWKGVQKGIISSTVEVFERHGVRPKDIVVALGPSIGACCFEVSSDLLDQFQKSWGWLWTAAQVPYFKSTHGAQGRKKILDELDLHPALSTVAKSKKDTASIENIDASDSTAVSLWFDLKALAKMQLRYLGILEEHTDDLSICTYCGVMRLHGQVLRPESPEFASYRRGGHTGQVAGRQWSTIRI